MITLYSSDNCQQCKMSKMLLDMKGIDYKVKMLGVDFTRDEIKSIAPNVRSFPVVFNDVGLVGDFNALKEYLNKLK